MTHTTGTARLSSATNSPLKNPGPSPRVEIRPDAGVLQRTANGFGMAIVALAICGSVQHAHAAAASWAERLSEGLIVFPELRIDGRFDASDDVDVEPAVDLFYARDFDRFRLLAEFFVSEDEQMLERFQIGWLIGPDDTVWAGRFHVPLGYWNAAYHHGTHLQTTTSRPGIVEFEDDGGILPLHLAGGILQGRRPLSDAELAYQIALGAGPELTEGGLQPFDFFNPASRQHEVSSAMSMSLHRDRPLRSEVGVFAGRFELPSNIAGVRSAQLSVGGGWALWQYRSLRVLAAGFLIHDKVKTPGGASAASFSSGYVQGEYRPNDDWSLYGRIEASGGTDDDPYLAFFPEFAQQTYLGGIRFNLTERHALRLEFADRSRLGDDFQEVIFQWSAALP